MTDSLLHKLSHRLRAALVDIAWGFGVAVRRDPMARQNLHRWRGRWRGMPLPGDSTVIPYRWISEDEVRRRMDA